MVRKVLDVGCRHGRGRGRGPRTAAPRRRGGFGAAASAAAASTAATAPAEERLRRLEPPDVARPLDALVGEAYEIHDRRGRVRTGASRGRNEVVALAEREDRGDVAPREHILHQPPGFRLADHVRAGVRLVVGILVLEIAIEVDAAGAVLVVEAVPIAVGPFPVDRVAARLAPGRIGTAHQSRIVRMDHVGPVRVLHTHDRDDAVFVQVLGTVLIRPAVVVVVELRGVGLPGRLDRREHQLGAVGVDARDDVERVRVEPLLDRRIGGVPGEQPLGDEERQFAADHLVPFEVRRDEQRRTLGDRDAGRVRDLDGPDRTPFPCLGDLDELRQVRVRRRQLAQRRRHLVVGVIAGVISGRERRRAPAGHDSKKRRGQPRDTPLQKCLHCHRRPPRHDGPARRNRDTVSQGTRRPAARPPGSAAATSSSWPTR